MATRKAAPGDKAAEKPRKNPRRRSGRKAGTKNNVNRPKYELSEDLSDPIKAARLEWIWEMYSSLCSRRSIVRFLMAGRKEEPEKNLPPIPPLAQTESYAHFDLALRIFGKDDDERVAESRRWHRAQLIRLARQASVMKQPGVAADILDRVGILDGVVTPKGQGGSTPPEKKPLLQLSDAELIELIRKEESEKK